MSFLCVRIDLDYVPWDTPDARQFGHGEPAMLLRLLELARRAGYRWHFFASERFLRAFPTGADAVLNDGHDLDYYAKHPEQPARWEEAQELFLRVGHRTRGWAIREAWTANEAPAGIEFFSGTESASRVRLFPVSGRSLHEAVRGGQTLRAWLDREVASLVLDRPQGNTVVVSPQVLARVDPRLAGLEELIERAFNADLPLRTLRQISLQSPRLSPTESPNEEA